MQPLSVRHHKNTLLGPQCTIPHVPRVEFACRGPCGAPACAVCCLGVLGTNRVFVGFDGIAAWRAGPVCGQQDCTLSSADWHLNLKQVPSSTTNKLPGVVRAMADGGRGESLKRANSPWHPAKGAVDFSARKGPLHAQLHWLWIVGLLSIDNVRARKSTPCLMWRLHA